MPANSLFVLDVGLRSNFTLYSRNFGSRNLLTKSWRNDFTASSVLGVHQASRTVLAAGPSTGHTTGHQVNRSHSLDRSCGRDFRQCQVVGCSNAPAPSPRSQNHSHTITAHQSPFQPTIPTQANSAQPPHYGPNPQATHTPTPDRETPMVGSSYLANFPHPRTNETTHNKERKELSNQTVRSFVRSFVRPSPFARLFKYTPPTVSAPLPPSLPPSPSHIHIRQHAL